MSGPHATTEFTPGHTIPAGTRINDYRIDRVLGEGGFGIVYLATDVALERRVAIKEYLPSSMAARAGGALTVMVKSPSHQETFAMGLRSFVNEAKLLAHFDHPSLVKVHQFWEENGTAYMVMQYYEGPTLKQVLAKLGRLPTEAEVRAWLMPLLDALEVLHNEHCYHRDVAPDNILLTEHGPLLLDFGAARRVIGDATHALTAMLKPGFAPIEQYGEMPDVNQGPWTDIFALASVLYAAISGSRPIPSVERLLSDKLRPLAQVAAGRCSHALLAAVDSALALHPKDRPQSIAEFRALLMADDTLPMDLLGADPGETTAVLDFDPTQPAADHTATQLESIRRAPRAPQPTPVAPPRPASSAAQPLPAQTPLPPAPATRRGMLLALAGGASLAGLAWAGYSLWARPAAPALTEAPPPSPAAAPASAAPTPAPVPAPVAAAPEPTPSASAASAAASVPAPAPALAPALAPAPPPAVASPAPAPRPRPTAPATATAPDTRGSKCSDILQKASLEPLTPAETAYLKKECR